MSESNNNDQTMEWQDKIQELEMSQAYHDDSIAELEKTVAAQHQEIQLLKKQLQLLSEYIKTMRQDAVKDIRDEAPPPHY